MDGLVFCERLLYGGVFSRTGAAGVWRRRRWGTGNWVGGGSGSCPEMEVGGGRTR